MSEKIYFDLNGRYRNIVSKKLISHEINIDEKNEVINYLSSINYFKLKPYVKCIEEQMINSNDTFHFYDVIELYKIDRRLRASLIKIIEIVEISVKTFLVDFLHKDEDKSIFEYLDLNNFKSPENQNDKDKEIYDKFLNSLKQKINDIKNPKSQYYSNMTQEEKNELNNYLRHENLPFWVIVERLDFGDITSILKYISKRDLKEIFNKIGDISYPIKNISVALNGIRYIRNMCSHNSRLYNQSIKYCMPKSMVSNLSNSIGLIRYLMFIKLFVEKYDSKSWSKFCEELDEILNSHKVVNTSLLHFPDEYRDYLSS